MKVLFFSYAYPNVLHPDLGTFNRTMIAGLAGDHDVRVISPVPFVEAWQGWFRGKLPRGLNDPQFAAVPGVKAEYASYYYTPRLFRSQYGRWLWWSVKSRLNRAMNKFRPDVVLSYWAHPDGEVAVRMAHRHGIPAVAMVGGSDVLLLGRSGSRRHAILNVMRHADAVVTVSDHIANTLVSDGIEHDRVHVVRRGVDRALFSPGDRAVARRGLGLPEDPAILVAVGRLVPVKGFTHLIQACRHLADRNGSFRCFILGDGPLQAELQQKIERLGLQGVVELKGPQPQSQLVEWYRAANLTVLPSLSEGVPNVLLESLACGTPFVATQVGGIPEIADPRHDRLVPPESPVALADAIERQLKMPRDRLPVRCFEPLALRAAARRLGQVLDEVQAESQAVHPEWKDFHEATPIVSATSALGRSAEFCLDRSDFPKTEVDPMQTTDFERETHELPVSTDDSAFTRPANGLIEEELGRTAENFVLPKR